MKKTPLAIAAAIAVTAPEATPLFIPLPSLFLSAGNVRKTAPTRIERLAATILSQGLLHALHVTAELDADGKPTGRYAVEAGGRRLRALQWLAANGKIFPDFPVECRLIEAGRASKVSLIENNSQEAMHPADEFAAYQTLITEGNTLEEVADEFGETVVHVQRRLKMANVAPELLALYRNGEMTLDQVMALASVDDQERQLLVWNGLPYYSRQAQTIKSRLTEDEVAASDARVKVVGLDVYIAAGGSMRADLFSEEGTQYLTDCGLLEMLLGECVEEQAELVRGEGWSWVEFVPSYGYQEQQQYRKPQAKYLPETPEIEAARVALEIELEEVEAQNEAAQNADDWGKSEELDEQQTAIEGKIEALKAARLDSSDADISTTGAVMTFSDAGFIVHRGLTRRADMQATAGGGENTIGAAKSTRAEVPEKLMLDLSSHRTAAIQASLIANPQVALAALAHKMAMSTFDKYNATSPIKISLTQNRNLLEKNSLSLSSSRAASALDAEFQAWQQRLPEGSDKWFSWLLEQPQDVVLSLIVFATANCADALQSRLDSSDDAGPIARALKLDMADWWEASPTAYLELVPKSKLIETVSETAGAQVANEMLKMKKPEAIAFAASHTEGKRWLPLALRVSPSASNTH